MRGGGPQRLSPACARHVELAAAGRSQAPAVAGRLPSTVPRVHRRPPQTRIPCIASACLSPSRSRSASSWRSCRGGLSRSHRRRIRRGARPRADAGRRIRGGPRRRRAPRGAHVRRTGAAPITNAVVVVTDDKITAAGPASTVTVPAGARVVTSGRPTLLPGSSLRTRTSSAGPRDPGSDLAVVKDYASYGAIVGVENRAPHADGGLHVDPERRGAELRRHGASPSGQRRRRCPVRGWRTPGT